LGEIRAKNSYLPQSSAPERADGLEISFFKMQPVGHHKLDAIFFGRGNHRFALIFGHRHRLFAQDVYSRLGSTNGIFLVQMVW